MSKFQDLVNSILAQYPSHDKSIPCRFFFTVLALKKGDFGLALEFKPNKHAEAYLSPLSYIYAELVTNPKKKGVDWSANYAFYSGLSISYRESLANISDDLKAITEFLGVLKFKLNQAIGLDSLDDFEEQ